MVSEAELPKHLRTRPTWNCLACGHPWPCASVKGELVVEFRRHPSSLTVYMSAYLCEAMNDLTAPDGIPPADLLQRFLGWVRPSVVGLAINPDNGW
jgi:hypothetical protein